EALIKESELIKKLKPKFNVLMRDSKNYLFVGFTHDEFPKIILTHQPSELKTKNLKLKTIVGPFTDSDAVRKTLHLLREIFPYCTCRQKHSVKCLNAHMGRCLTYCCLKKSTQLQLQPESDRFLAVVDQHRNNIKAIKAILSGRNQILLKELRKEIKQTIKLQNFEKAQTIKNKINNLESVLNHARVLTDKQEFYPAIFKDDEPNFKLLGLEPNPKRIETYDVSNLHGQKAVGSMVVFELQKNGLYQANKNEYRQFKIKTVAGINDPAMMAEIVKRRLNNNWLLPQLIIVDGGRTQLNTVLKTLGSRKIRIISLAKKLEEIYLPELAEPVLAQKFGQSLKHLFQAIRDEAHRFALNYHRKLRHRSFGH
ncbi:MAG: UvrB/UvrC motif-containing protein, partial [Candidatus Sungbacteria bacterium]|nr:UvrB/UvrC motif-containing protein [Candidatus Sungbacteria bacterium]